jgi:hypothetical protein
MTEGIQQENLLTTFGHNYLQFLDRAGYTAKRMPDQELGSLFASGCKKIVNGKTLCETNEHLKENLWKAQTVYGKWRINQQYELYPSTSTNCVTMKYIAETTKSKLLVIAILKLDSEGKITEIDEVYSTLEEEEKKQ